MAEARKSIFITGAASGIGRVTAKYFAARGWFVGLYDIAPMNEVEKEIPAEQRISGVLDVRDPAAWKAAVAGFGAATGGKMHVFFNNAGVGRGGPFEGMPQDELDLVVDVNLKGVINGLSAAIPLLKQTHGARVINTASAASIYGTPGLAVYSATKFAVRGLSEALDIELRKYGVRVCCLMPWFVDTPILDHAPHGSNRTLRDSLKSVPIYPVSLVAEAVWKAAHNKALYVAVGKATRDLQFAAKFLPGAVRAQLAKDFAAGDPL